MRLVLFIDSIDLEAGTVTVDVAQWLEGEEANVEYAAATGDQSGVPNDYYIRNSSVELRTLPLRSLSVTVA